MNKTVPRHIAVIMDGNGRWARERGLPRIAGHRAGVAAVRSIVEESARCGIGYLTLFAFSRENWQRPGNEVTALMELLDLYLKKELAMLRKNNVRLRTIGHSDDLPPAVLKTLRSVEMDTLNNDGLTLVLALSYSGKQDIVDAVRQISGKVASGKIALEDVGEITVDEHLATKGIPDPDLLIRTSGEMRVSNFLLWQTAYTEFYVTDKFWPDFSADDLREAIEEFRKRERRYGLTSDQMKAGGK
ncbi:MAG: isoprenyl transferase [bacterium]